MSDPIVPICTHKKVNGEQCRVAALQGRQLCHFHDESEKRRRTSARISRRLADRNRRTINSPVLEDPNAVQLAIMETIHAFLDKRLEHKDASLMFYALQTAASNVKSVQLSDSAPHWSFKEELEDRRSKIEQEIKKYNQWVHQTEDQIRKMFEQEFKEKLETMKKPPAEAPAPASTTATAQ